MSWNTLSSASPIGHGDARLPLSELPQFTRRVFASLPRADQRGWAELYVRGLLSATGKKSLKRIADSIGMPTAAHSLQQFVNQSPWKWDTLSRAAAAEVLRFLSPKVWVVNSLVLPKRGSQSVGVDQYYSARLQRTVNGQVGVGLFLTSEAASIPVSWRILLSERWLNDSSLRAKVRIPEDYGIRTAWQGALDLLDTARSQWRAPALPVVADLRGVHAGGELLQGLGDRKLDYLIEVDPSTRILETQPQAILRGRPRTSGLVSSLVRPARSRPHSPKVRLLAASSADGRGARCWLTNMADWSARVMAELEWLRKRHERDLTTLQEQFGVEDFEGRSFGGWHRHMMMASAAFAFDRIHGVDHHPGGPTAALESATPRGPAVPEDRSCA